MLFSNQTLSKEFNQTYINFCYQTLIDGAFNQTIDHEWASIRYSKYTHHYLTFNYSNPLWTNERVSLHPKLLIVVPNHHQLSKNSDIQIFGHLIRKSQAEEIPLLIECSSHEFKKISQLILRHSSTLKRTVKPQIKSELVRSHIPCFSCQQKQLFKHPNGFIIQEFQEEVQLDISPLPLKEFSLTFDDFVQSIKQSTLTKTSFDNKQVIKFLLSRPAIEDEIQLALLTQLILKLPNIKTHHEWQDCLNQQQFTLFPQSFMDDLKNIGIVINPKLYDYYDFIQTYFNQQKRLSL